MTQTIAIIGRQDVRTSYDTPQSMVAGLQATGSATNYVPVTFDELVFAYNGQQLTITANNLDIAQANGIFLFGWFKQKMHEDIALAVSVYAKQHNVPVLNSEAAATRSRSKLSQSVYAVLQEVAITPFIFSLSHEALLAKLDAMALLYPLIVKSAQGARGGDNHLVQSRQDLLQVLKDNPDVPFMVQTYVPNDGDYRILVMGDNVTFAMHRQAQQGTHLSNTSQGGAATHISVDELPLAMQEQAVRIAKALRREVTGVDMIVDKNTGQHYLLEINNMPQLSTGSLVAEKMAALDTFLTSCAA